MDECAGNPIDDNSKFGNNNDHDVSENNVDSVCLLTNISEISVINVRFVVYMFYV